LVSRIAGAARLLATGKLAPTTGFDGAQMQRRLMAWRAGGESINSLILQGGELQRARARQLVRTNPYAANAAASFTAHAVGAGIKPSSLVEDGALKDQIQRLWLAWTDEADADGLTDFYGLQAMAARAMFEAGECFFRFRARRPEDPGSGPGQAPLTVPLELQMLSSEHLPLGKCETLPNGHEIIFGIELDRIGRRVAYHFHRTHPGDVRQRGVGELVRVPADQVCHLFHPIAEGQIRGVPWVAPAMVRLWLLDQYDDAELDRKKVAAMFAGFVTRPGPDDVMGEDSAQKDQDSGEDLPRRAEDARARGRVDRAHQQPGRLGVRRCRHLQRAQAPRRHDRSLDRWHRGLHRQHDRDGGRPGRDARECHADAA
jgi:lambda family phage portal protein